MTSLKGRRKLIGISALSGSAADTYPTLYERAQTKGCFDLRWAGNNSEVRIIKPAKEEVKK